MNIILMGYRGSGKTTLGRLLADQTWRTFVDVDDRIRARFEGQTIAQIWQTHGEPAFRAAEVDVTRELCAGSQQVIALGGGTLMQPLAREAVVAAPDAVRIYLACDAKVLYQRITGDGQSAATRPALTTLGGGLAEIEAVLAERDPVYRAVADKVFDVTHLAPTDALRHLIARCL